ncbi:MAG: heparan-alpha-glucosaminide N-acetyltransferase domain-containing protein [Flavobacteriales bacterium]|nr:heparan-alpha-glucosaminide N-acetyltransferase domain-containing protein [Flavobacteriales bacterium]
MKNLAKNRIIGIDVARALAVIGMIIVNFKVVFGENGGGWLKSFAGIFDGKAAATFVVLAGVGLALMTNASFRNRDEEKLKKAQIRILKRAIFLFIVGLSYILIWPADILHFYGVYMLITALFITQPKKFALTTGILLIALYPVLLTSWNYESGWNFTTLDYPDFWTAKGFVKNLLFNGFHPVLPWLAFMLVGFWFGRQRLNDNRFVMTSFFVGLISFILVQLISFAAVHFLSEGDPIIKRELQEVLGTDPMPPLPIYMFSGISIAITITSACILIAKKFEQSKIIDALRKTGQLALTFYAAHVIIGMGIVEAIDPEKMGNYSIEFSVIYALVFSALCIVFAIIWRKRKKSGPLESIMRKLTD